MVEFESPIKKTKEELARMSAKEFDMYLRSVPGYDRVLHPVARMGGGMVERVSIEHGISDILTVVRRSIKQ